jgi:hypothetical protein
MTGRDRATLTLESFIIDNAEVGVGARSALMMAAELISNP